MHTYLRETWASGDRAVQNGNLNDPGALTCASGALAWITPGPDMTFSWAGQGYDRRQRFPSD